MTVEELIQELKKMPKDARVFHIWDGAPRTAINEVYLSKGGNVMTIDTCESVFSPIHSPVDYVVEEKSIIAYESKCSPYNPLDDLEK